ncbi:hypothetical protein KW796_02250 [Candidatus Parcubacteria bacterium]|nr:hypothetical protein [Candidatus Parcubacteria bacterium]
MTNARDLAKFAILIGLFGILSDSMIGHALMWENDPYWTYWITKTALITTVFALGTAWLGSGYGKGAIITLVHTIILTVYYWTFSPVGLPDEPKWLDLSHTWVTGIPIHFLVIYIGYAIALWLWRKTHTNENFDSADARSAASRAVIGAVLISVVSGILSSLLLGEFVGVTWFITRILIIFPFLLFWYGYLEGRYLAFGSLILTLVLTGYSHYLSPLGLPGEWRLFENFMPVTIPRWLDYGELWLRQFPSYLVSSAAGLWLLARKNFK